jgi:hypothetical protein
VPQQVCGRAHPGVAAAEDDGPARGRYRSSRRWPRATSASASGAT